MVSDAAGARARDERGQGFSTADLVGRAAPLLFLLRQRAVIAENSQCLRVQFRRIDHHAAAPPADPVHPGCAELDLHALRIHRQISPDRLTVVAFGTSSPELAVSTAAAASGAATTEQMEAAVDNPEYAEMIEKTGADIREGDILILHTGWHKYYEGQKQQDLVRRHFEKNGATVTFQKFDGKQPSQRQAVPMANLIARFNPGAS